MSPATSATYDAGPPMIDELIERMAAMAEPGTAIALPLGIGPERQPVVVGVPVDGQRLVVGRVGGAITVDHPLVSRRHAELWCAEGHLQLVDAGSRNGTWVVRDGERLPAATALEVYVGDDVVTEDGLVVFTIGDRTAP